VKILSCCLAVCLILLVTACQSDLSETELRVEPTLITTHYSISTENFNQIAPEDVIVEVIYFGNGMNDPGRSCSWDYEKPSLGYVSKPTYAMQRILIVTCGWPSGGKVDVEITQPDGIREFQEVTADNRGKVELYYFVPWNGPDGAYQFEMKRKFSTLEYSFEITHPIGPFASYFNDQKRLNIFQFQPLERVRVFLFDSKDDYHFTGWFEVIMNKDGGSVVEIKLNLNEHPFFIVVGDDSGQVVANEPDLAQIGDMYCRGAPLPMKGIHIDSVVQVITQQLKANETYLPQGTNLVIREGPMCRNQMYWWTGVVEGTTFPRYDFPEGNSNEYFIKPIDKE